jgi:hypothetical protein
VIAAHVISAPDGNAETDYGTWEFLSLPAIGESISFWNPVTDLPDSGRVVSVIHHPRGPKHDKAHVLIIIKPNR